MTSEVVAHATSLAVKEALKDLLARRWLSRIWAPVMRGRFPIFTLHRFAPRDSAESPGMPVVLLDQILARLRSDGYRFVALREAVESFDADSTTAARSVVFTVDDGYADFVHGAEVFRAHQCPVTVFLTTGFLDGACWMWWDQIEYVCLHCHVGRYQPIDSGPLVTISSDDRGQRVREAARVAAQCTGLPDSDRRRFVEELTGETGVQLPRQVPGRYRALDWGEVRRLEAAGAHFAPHTVTHPVLSRAPDDLAAQEIEESWLRVQEELSAPVPVFAYPNGTPRDFGPRELRIVESSGLIAAVTTVPDYVDCHAAATNAPTRLTLPRFPQPKGAVEACLVANGFSRLRRYGRSRQREHG